MLPQYSGGLGILAGDHLKTASDLGVPIVGVGLFYKTGYFKQSLNRDGWQVETYPVLDPDGLPLSLLREEDGTPAVVTVSLPAGRRLHAHVWKAQVGRVPLLLLDSDVPGNDEQTRKVTESLYGGGGDTRLEQEPAPRHRWRPRPAPLVAPVGRPDAGGLPHERGPRRLPRGRAHHRASSATTA